MISICCYLGSVAKTLIPYRGLTTTRDFKVIGTTCPCMGVVSTHRWAKDALILRALILLFAFRVLEEVNHGVSFNLMFYKLELSTSSKWCFPCWWPLKKTPEWKGYSESGFYSLVYFYGIKAKQRHLTNQPTCIQSTGVELLILVESQGT